MAKKVTVDKLGSAIRDILNEYQGSVVNDIGLITREVTKKGVQALKTESRATFGQVPQRKKKYANTWTATTLTGRYSTQGTIYNTQPGLPHLLENGHVCRNGTGRKFDDVPGRVHIAKVEKELVESFERELKGRL